MRVSLASSSCNRVSAKPASEMVPGLVETEWRSPPLRSRCTTAATRRTFACTNTTGCCEPPGEVRSLPGLPGLPAAPADGRTHHRLAGPGGNRRLRYRRVAYNSGSTIASPASTCARCSRSA
jgi:hypothetical protein